jgi:hypothetical protein
VTETYRSEEVRPSAEGAPVVIHCSDPRFQPHFQDFLSKHLSLDHYALIAVPGGAQLLKVLDFLPKFSWVGWRWIKFMVDLTQAERIILIVHDDCRWYLQDLFGHDRARVHERMIDDALRVRAGLLERFGDRAIEVYHARLAGTRAVFDRVK